MLIDKQYTLNGIKEIFDKYSLKKNERGIDIVIDRKTGNVVDDLSLRDKVKFSIAWVKATQYERSRTTLNKNLVTQEDYCCAFDKGSKITYAKIMNTIHKELITTGNIDPIEIVDECANVPYSHAQSIARGLLSRESYANVVDKWARLAYPDALEKNRPVYTYMQSLEQQPYREGKRIK